MDKFYYINLIKKIIEITIETYNELGLGLTKNNYLQYMANKINQTESCYNLAVNLSQNHNNNSLSTAYITNLIIDNKIIVELITEEKILPYHENNLLTSMKSAQIELGLLINFKKMFLNDGIRILIFQNKKDSQLQSFSNSFNMDEG